MGRVAIQHGGTLSAFHGTRIQRGYGLGGLLKGLFRVAVPLLKQGAKAVGRTALKTGSQIVGDVLQGGDIKTSARNRTQQARQELSNKATRKVIKMIGGGGAKVKKRSMSKTKKSKSKTGNRRMHLAATKRMKGAVLKKSVTFPRTTKGLTSLARREGYKLE